MSMIPDIDFKVGDDAVFKHIPVHVDREGSVTYKTDVVMTKEIFQECYKKWIKPQVQIVCKSCSKEEKSDLINRQELLNDIDKAIETIIQYDAYSVEMRNGMRFVRSLIANEKPEYE